MSDINDLLQGPNRVTKARNYIAEVAVPAMEQAAKEAAEAQIEIGAARMIAQPMRIIRAVYGQSFSDWAPTGSASYLIGILADCRQFIANLRNLGKQGHWAYDGSRLIGLLQAERALATKIEKGDYR